MTDSEQRDEGVSQDSVNRGLELQKYPSLKYPDDPSTDGLLSDGELVFIEKLDGANCRFKLVGDELLFGSRNVMFTENGEVPDLDRIDGAFRHVVQYLRRTVDFDALRDIEDEHGELWFYGEAMHKHSIDYDAWEGREPDVEGDFPNFIGFDVWSRDSEEWLSWDDIVSVYERIGLQTPKEIRRKSASEVTESDREIPPSEFRDENPDADTEFDRRGLAEGVVIRNDLLGIKAKLVHDEFKETDQPTFSDTEKAKSEGGRFVQTYCTDARIRKVAHKIVDDPQTDFDELAMPMMELLPKRVLADVMAEHGWELLNNDMDLSEETKGQIRNRASKRCVHVLKEELNALA